MKGSAATLRPTCFMVTSARRPTIDTPTAASYAVFSFAHQATVEPGVGRAEQVFEDLG